MPQEPKKRHSRQRQGKRRASIKLVIKDYSHRLKKSPVKKTAQKNRSKNENSK